MPTITEVFTDVGEGSWICPFGVSLVSLRAVAGGGPGQGGSNSAAGRGGAGGGSENFSSSSTPGQTYDFTIGAGGTGDDDGGPTYSLDFDDSILANGGLSGANGGVAGDPGIGDVGYLGGAGAVPMGIETKGGGGGAGAQATSDGANATTGTGATGDGSGNGDGGDGGTLLSPNGQAGSAPGGAGGGGAKLDGASGGDGAPGSFTITYTVPAVLDDPNLLYDFNANDLDGDGTNNASYSDMADAITLKNLSGLTGGNATVGVTGYSPTLCKPCFDNQAGIAFRATLGASISTYFKLTGSKSVFKPHNDGAFEVFIVFRPYPNGLTMGLLSSTITGGEKGLRISVDGYGSGTPGVLRVLLLSPSLTNTFTAVVTTDTVNYNETNILVVRGDGTKLYASLNRGDEVSTSYAGSFDSGDGTRDFFIGANNSSDAEIDGFSGELARLTIVGAEIADAERDAYLDYLETLYPLGAKRNIFVMSGDSITAWSYDRIEFGRRLAGTFRVPQYGNVNFGAPAQPTTTLLSNYNAKIAGKFTGLPHKILVVQGSWNDASFRTGANSTVANAAADAAFANQKSQVETAAAANIAGTDRLDAIVWVNLTPAGEATGTTASGVLAIRRYNAAHAAYVANTATPVLLIDAYTLLADNAAGNFATGIPWAACLSHPASSTGTKANYYTSEVSGGSDGAHPNDAAAQALASLIAGMLPSGTVSSRSCVAVGVGVGI